MTITISYLPIKYYNYFQWLLVGFYKLEDNSEIKLKFNLPVLSHLYFFCLPIFLQKVFTKYFSKIFCKYELPLIRCNLFFNNKKYFFCYEVNDSPYWFSEADLISSDLYFKAQHPTSFDKNGFELCQDVFIKYPDFLFQNIGKIKPSMLGPRMLCVGIKKTLLLNSYNNFIKFSNSNKEKYLMSYFGSAKFSYEIDNYSLINDMNNEAYLMYKFQNKLVHPNIKRGILHKYLKNSLLNIDSRIIDLGDNEIALDRFQEHVSKFKYNLNVSGFRLSIPNRFIDSFAVGTCILTDKLSIKWYKPFTCEVLETEKIGYLKLENIDWESIFFQINNLPNPDYNAIIKKFNDSWAPDVFAKYILNELLKLNEI